MRTKTTGSTDRPSEESQEIEADFKVMEAYMVNCPDKDVNPPRCVEESLGRVLVYVNDKLWLDEDKQLKRLLEREDFLGTLWAIFWRQGHKIREWHSVSVVAWFSKVLKRLTTKSRKKYGPQLAKTDSIQGFEGDSWEDTIIDSPQNETVTRSERLRDLFKKMFHRAKLTPREILAMELYYLEELSYEYIANTNDNFDSADCVRGVLKRARRKLRECFTDSWFDLFVETEPCYH